MNERTEIIKTLAEKVMGWEQTSFCGGAWEKNGRPICALTEFNPFTSSADNDALVEAFVGKGVDYDVCIASYYGEVTAMINDWDEKLVQITGDYTTAKKNEAVCMAIYEAVTK